MATSVLETLTRLTVMLCSTLAPEPTVAAATLQRDPKCGELMNGQVADVKD